MRFELAWCYIELHMEPQKQTPPLPNQISGHPLVKKFQDFSAKNFALSAGVVVVIILLGLGTGWVLSGRSGGLSGLNVSMSPGAGGSTKEAGFADEKTFKDTAEGTLVEGGISGEGTHHLERSGGISQNVYLTSTVINLQDFVGKKVQVWGETTSGRKAGWLMDVGKVKVIE